MLERYKGMVFAGHFFSNSSWTISLLRHWPHLLLRTRHAAVRENERLSWLSMVRLGLLLKLPELKAREKES